MCKRIFGVTPLIQLAIIFNVGLLVLLSSAAIADEQNERGARSESKRIAKMLGPKAARELSKAQDALLAEDYRKSIDLMTSLLAADSRISAFDRAKTFQILSYAHINSEDYPKAIEAAEQALNLRELEWESTVEVHYQLANLNVYIENYDSGLEHLLTWFEMVETPKTEAFFMTAQIYALQNNYEMARDYSDKGLAQHRREHISSAEIEPRKNWYNLTLAVYLHQREFKGAIPLLEEMLNHWPNDAPSFSQLSAIYQELEQEMNSLAVASIAQQNGLLKKIEDYNRLLQLYRVKNYPYHGARVFDDFLLSYEKYEPNVQQKASEEKKSAKVTDKHWQELSSAWLQSREWQKAKGSLIKAAEISPSGKNWFQLCETEMNDDHWSESRDYCLLALKKGRLNDDGAAAWRMIGLAHYRQENLEQAQQAFRECVDWPESNSSRKLSGIKKECGNWQTFLKETMQIAASEEKRLEQDEKDAQQRREQRIQSIDSYAR